MWRPLWWNVSVSHSHLLSGWRMRRPLRSNSQVWMGPSGGPGWTKAGGVDGTRGSQGRPRTPNDWGGGGVGVGGQGTELPRVASDPTPSKLIFCISFQYFFLSVLLKNHVVLRMMYSRVQWFRFFRKLVMAWEKKHFTMQSIWKFFPTTKVKIYQVVKISLP
jgi:hypothetical protein